MVDLLLNTDESSFTNTSGPLYRANARHPPTLAERIMVLNEMKQLLLHGKRQEALAAALNGTGVGECLILLVK